MSKKVINVTSPRIEFLSYKMLIIKFPATRPLIHQQQQEQEDKAAKEEEEDERKALARVGDSCACRGGVETYGTLEMSKQIAKLLPNLVQNIQVLEGDGGVGTVLAVTLSPNVAGFSGYKEKFTKVDSEKHAKEVEMVEGGFLDMGFLLYRVRLEILERDGDSSIIRSTVEYEIAEESAAYASLITTDMLAIIAEVVGKHIAEEHKAKVNA